MRDDVMMKLVDHAMTDEEFRKSALVDLHGTLQRHGYELEADELEAVQQFHSEVAHLDHDAAADAIAERAGSGFG